MPTSHETILTKLRKKTRQFAESDQEKAEEESETDDPIVEPIIGHTETTIELEPGHNSVLSPTKVKGKQQKDNNEFDPTSNPPVESTQSKQDDDQIKKEIELLMVSNDEKEGASKGTFKDCSACFSYVVRSCWANYIDRRILHMHVQTPHV